MNTLYPIFVKLHKLKILIVGAGEVGHEKLSFMLKNSPDAHITVVAEEVLTGVQSILDSGKYDIRIKIASFQESDVEGFDLIVAATNIKEVNKAVWSAAKTSKILVNVADTPDLCDFYLGSIISRGDVKIAISTNGKSPTFAKRLRQIFEDIIPHNTNDLVQNLHEFRNQLKGDFEYKVNQLNEVTKSLLH